MRHGHVVTGIMLAFSQLAWAEPPQVQPPSIVAWTMNEPFTLLDWGIYRLQEELDHTHLNIWRDGGGDVESDGIYASFRLGENKILIHALYPIDSNPKEQPIPESTLRTLCERGLTQIRAFLDADIHTRPDVWGKDFPSKYDYLFAHPGGLKHANQPKDLGRQLEALTEIRIRLVIRLVSTQGAQNRETGVPSKVLMCRGPLLGNDVTLTKLMPIQEAPPTW